jgi:hypothetical protein
MTMKWFGVSWGAPMNDECPEVPPPVGEICQHCGEGIVAADSGVVYANGPVMHRNCFLRSAFGSRAHFERRCSCYVPGSTCGDPEGMTPREAANDLARALGYEDEPEMCDFCAARGPLPMNVHAIDICIGHFKSGAVLQDSGVWGACAECAELIQAKKWQELMEYSIAGLAGIFPERAFDLKFRAQVKDMIEHVFGVKL